LQQFPDFVHTFFFETRLQFVLEKLFSEQVQAVARYSAKYRVNHARGKLSIRGIKKRTQYRHEKDEPSAAKAI
jgi:hypothetical protein